MAIHSNMALFFVYILEVRESIPDTQSKTWHPIDRAGYKQGWRYWSDPYGYIVRLWGS